MTQAITLAGEQLLAAKYAANETANIDKFVFAYIDDITSTDTVDRSQTMPAAADIKATIDVASAGVVNSHSVVFSCVMDSSQGTWSFNWMGLYSSEDDTIVAIAYLPEQEKRATVGLVLGNVYTKNFALDFNGATDVTGITIDAQSWQIDYTARLRSMDEIQRIAAENDHGRAHFETSAFTVTYSGSEWQLGEGAGIVAGLNVETVQQTLDPGTLPTEVWIQVYREQSMAGVENKYDIVFGSNFTDTTENGVDYYREKLAVLTSTSNIEDSRLYVGELETWHKGNLKPATTERAGYSQLSNETKGNSETKAATEKAVNLAMPIGGIIMWSGKINAIPDGWALCDGENETPNLTDRFIIGAGGELSAGDTGGSKAKTTTSAGSHSHNITVNSHTLSTSQMPSHAHDDNYVSGNNVDSGKSIEQRQSDGHRAGSFKTKTGGYTGSSNSHNHSASSDSKGAHTHSIEDVRPPYYALAFIMKTAGE